MVLLLMMVLAVAMTTTTPTTMMMMIMMLVMTMMVANDNARFSRSCSVEGLNEGSRPRTSNCSVSPDMFDPLHTARYPVVSFRKLNKN